MTRGKVPLEDMQNWFSVLMTEGPKESAYNEAEVQEFFNHHVGLSAADAVEKGVSFESWFKGCCGALEIKSPEKVKKNFLEAYNFAAETLDNLKSNK